MKAASTLIAVLALMLFLPLVVPAWMVLAVGMPTGFGLLYLVWRELA